MVSLNVLKREVTLNVDGQRIEVGDRDLGLVVRWDPSSKNAEPPPSMTRAEAIEQGLMEPEPEEEPVAVSAAMPEAAPIELGRGPDESGGRGRGRPGGRRGGRGRQGGGPRPDPSPPERKASEPPKGRVFRRASSEVAARHGRRRPPPPASPRGGR